MLSLPFPRALLIPLAHIVLTTSATAGATNAIELVAQESEAPDARWNKIREAMLAANQAGDSERALDLAREGLEFTEIAFGPDHPDTAAAAGMLAGSLHALGRSAEAEPLFRRALETIERTFGSGHIEALIPATRLANFYLTEKRFELAEPLYLRALAISNTRLGSDHEQSLYLTNDIAIIYSDRADYARAEELLMGAAPIAERKLGANHELTLRMANNLASLQMVQGQFEQAEQMFVRVLSGRTAALGPQHSETLDTMSDLSSLYLMRGRLTDAETLLEQVLTEKERQFGADHPSSLGAANDLGQLRYRQGRFADAERLHERARSGFLAASGPDSNATTSATNYLGKVWIEQGRYDEAEVLFIDITERLERKLGSEHPTSLLAVSNLGLVYNSQGRLAEAEPLLRRVLLGIERVYGPDHNETLQAKSNLGSILLQQGRFGDAEPLLVSAVEGGDRARGADNAGSLLAVSNLAILYENQNRLSEAILLLKRAVDSTERTLGPDHPHTLLFVSNMAVLEGRAGRRERAEELTRRVYRSRKRSLGSDHRDTLLAGNNLGVLLAANDRLEGEALLRTVLEISRKSLGEDHPDTVQTRFNLASVLTQAGRPDEAEPLFAHSLVSSRRTFGTDHPDTIATAAMLAAVRMALPSRAADAIEPARLFAAGSRMRRTSTQASRFADAQRNRETGLADGFLLLADALWFGSPEATNIPSIRDESFAALQDAVAGTTDRAIMQMTVRRLADQSRAGLGDLVRERDGLELQWDNANRRLAESFAASGEIVEAQRSTLRAERDQIANRLDGIDASIRREFPQFFDLVRPESLSLEATQKVLRDDEALLFVLPGFRGTHVVAVTSSQASWRRASWTREEINQAVRRLLWDVGSNVAVTPQEALEWEQSGGSGYPYDRSTAYALYNQIVAPVAALLSGKRHVFVAAGGALTSLPFGLLVTENPQGADGDPAELRSTSWFADAHALVQLPSVQSLYFLRSYTPSTKEAAPTGFLGFGDPLLDGSAVNRGVARGAAGTGAAQAVFGGDRGSSGLPLADARQLRSLARLPGTAVELEAMRAALGAPAASVRLREHATEGALRTTDLYGARIIALATHGLIAGEVSAAEPGLVFTPPGVSTEADDGLLTASEVAALRLQADWVILSACNTAAGDGAEGAPGLSGLARSFFYAGARSLLASHWPVRDDVAARLTVRIIEIEQAKPELSRAEAFQAAMREIRDNPASDTPSDTWAHPNAWAPFSLIGEGTE